MTYITRATRLHRRQVRKARIRLEEWQLPDVDECLTILATSGLIAGIVIAGIMLIISLY